MKLTVTRFAPSPTGFLHLGGGRTALYNYLFARKSGGKFILRIEDTDRERNKPDYEKDIVESVNWLGLRYDEFYRQSDRLEIYKKHLKRLIDKNAAYLSKEKEGERKEVVRFKNTGKVIKFNDLVRGEVKFNTTELGDFIIAKSLDEPLYHLAAVVDDYEMGVTDIIRAEEHLSNTPRQILIQEALSFPRPNYAHLPLILAPDRSKLSKRHGAVSVTECRQKGYLPEAVVNYLALLGWHPKDEQEIFSLNELVKRFDLGRVQKAGAIFNQEKLDWINKEHMRKNSTTLPLISSEIKKVFNLTNNGVGKTTAEKIAPIVFERISKLGDIETIKKSGELDFFFERPTWTENTFLWRGRGECETVAKRLNRVAELLEAVPEDNFDKDSVKKAIWDYAEVEGRGEILWPTRYGLSGKERSPDPFSIAEILGKKNTIQRIRDAASFLKHE